MLKWKWGAFILDKNRNILLIGIISMLFLVVQSWIQLNKDRYDDIEKAVHSMQRINIKIAQINKIESNAAIVFYEWGYGNKQQFGYVSVEKNIFGWKTMAGATRQLPPDRKMGWQHSEFPLKGNHSFLLTYGKIVDPKITQVIIIHNTKKVVAKIVNFNGGERFWYYMPNKVISGYLVVGLSKDGTMLEAH